MFFTYIGLIFAYGAFIAGVVTVGGSGYALFSGIEADATGFGALYGIALGFSMIGSAVFLGIICEISKGANKTVAPQKPLEPRGVHQEPRLQAVAA